MSLLALVADDHPPSVELACYLLESAGFEVVAAENGADAIALARARRPNVILLDLDLPVLNGCQVRDRLAADPALAAIPLVVMSVYEISEICPDRGPSDFAGYIRKPVEPVTFAEQVRAATTGRAHHE
jgi:CheY-like chemotaxis protein